MDTMKQLMGFVLLATVVYFYSTLSAAHVVPTMALMMGVWFACWWIGRTPVTAGPSKKITAWAGGIGVAFAVGLAAFTVSSPSDNRIPWQTFSPQAVAKAQAEGKTVMVEFTADWCWNCKYNLKYAINTKEVVSLVDRFEVVPLLADWTDRSDDIKRTLDQMGSRSIPLMAIYPAGKPQEVIVLRDLLSEDEVLAALKQAGPSATAEMNFLRTAMKSP
jgi:thiol:disulfide interchange protein